MSEKSNNLMSFFAIHVPLIDHLPFHISYGEFVIIVNSMSESVACVFNAKSKNSSPGPKLCRFSLTFLSSFYSMTHFEFPFK